MRKSLVMTVAAVGILSGGIFAASMVGQESPEPPHKVTAGGSAIYGMLTYSDDWDTPLGLYELTKSGAINKWECPNKYDMIGGWIKDGKICGYAVDKYGYQMRGFIYEEIDFETGNILKSIDIGITDAYFTVSALDPDDNVIYGYGKDKNGTVSFLKASGTSPEVITKVKSVTTDETFLSMCHNPEDGKLYGITKNYDHQLVTVDHEGVQTVVMNLNGSSDVCEDYITGLVWSPVEKLFYWNKYEGEESYQSSLCTIDPKTKSVKSIKNYNDEMQFSVYFTTDKVEVAGQPAAPLLTAVNFPNGALSGDVQFTLPAADINGTPLSGTVNWTVTVDDVAVGNGSGQPGTAASANIQSLTEGMHTFGVYVEASNVKSEKAFENLYIGKDTPQAPVNVVLTAAGLTWDAVTAGEHGGYVNAAEIEYEVKLDGESKGSTGTNSMQGIIPEGGQLAWYQATVSAKYAGKVSGETASNKVLAGKPLELPVNVTPTAEQFAVMQTVDIDGDSYSWKCRDGYMESQWSLSKDGGDDWVIMAPINFSDASAIYSLSFEAMRKMAESGRETLEVRLGSTPVPSEMSQVIMPTFEALVDYTEYNEVFKVPAAGTYYIAFHATSMKWEAGIENGQCVRNIKVKKTGIGNESPGAVTDLTATPAEKGGLNATVKFKMPVKTYTGESLNAKEVTATVSGEETKTVSGAPGSEQEVVVATKQGQNVLSVVTSVGDIEGTPVTVDVYTGVVVPGMVENLDFSIAEDMLSVEMTWNAPTQGVTPGYVDPATVKYHVYEAVQSFYDMSWELRGTTKLGETHFNYKVEAGNQKSHTLVVLAENVAGHGDEMMGGEVLLGTPYQLPRGEKPLVEDFENGSDYFQYTPWIKYQPDEETTGYWSVWPAENVVNGGEGNALIGKPTEANTKGRIGMPAFASNDDVGSVVLEFDALLNENTPELTVTGFCYGSEEEVTIGTLPSGSFDTMQPVVMVLPTNFNEATWIQLFFNTVYTKSTNLLVVDNVKVTKKRVSGVSDIMEHGAKVIVEDGAICVEGAAGKHLVIYSVSGMKIADMKNISDKERVNVMTGVYIVNVGSDKVKVAVR